jgi:hypothetical protein
VDPATIAAVSTAVVLVGGALIAGWMKTARPLFEKTRTFLDRIEQTINGKPAEYDAYNRETSPAILPLAEQQAATQKQLGQLTTAVQTLVEHADEIRDVKARVTNLELWKARVENLQQVERITGHLAQTAVVDAIDKAHGRAERKRDAIDEQPDVDAQ